QPRRRAMLPLPCLANVGIRLPPGGLRAERKSLFRSALSPGGAARERRTCAMFTSLWRRLRSRPPVRRKGTGLGGGRHLSFRPRLESLEDRVLPALGTGGAVTTGAVPGVVSGLQQSAIEPPAGTRPIQVTVAGNSLPTVIDLGPVFAAMGGIRHG